jgi:8-oxo-dGTP diphosphatase
MESVPPLIVTGAILIEDGRILVTQRLEKDAYGLYWEFPGGKVEPGESPEEALQRELLEELGIRVRVGPIYEVLFYRYPEHDVLLLFYRCERLGGEFRSLGCRQARMALPAELPDLNFLPADAPLVERLREGLG